MQDKIELIIVFKKEIELQDAQMILQRNGINHRKGMDSSKGKAYFYKTGPKFILVFESDQEKNKFISGHENLSEVYEIYTPNWSIRKA